MTSTVLTRAAAFVILLLPMLATGSEDIQLGPFPEASDGMTRLVIVLPEMPRDEASYSVELVAGRTVVTDGVNRVHMDTRLTGKTLEGWGYPYYEMSGEGMIAGTRMAVPEGTPAVERFVGGTPLTVRFNSRLPIVIYVPDGFEVRYRIWAAADEYLIAEPG